MVQLYWAVLGGVDMERVTALSIQSSQSMYDDCEGETMPSPF
jgi:hypothetical protein